MASQDPDDSIYWGLNKMANILQMTISNCISLNENLCSLIKILLILFLKGPIYNKLMLTQIYDAIWHY